MKQKLLLLIMFVLPFITGNVLAQNYHAIEPNVDDNYEAYGVNAMKLQEELYDWADIKISRQSNSSEFPLSGVVEGENTVGFLESAIGYCSINNTDLYAEFYVTNCVSVAVIYEGRGSSNRGVNMSISKGDNLLYEENSYTPSNQIKILRSEYDMDPTENYKIRIYGPSGSSDRLYQVSFEAPSGNTGPSNNTSLTNMNVNGSNISQIGTTFSVSIPNNYSLLTIPVQFTVHPTANVEVNGNFVENNNGSISTTVDTPESSATYNIVVTAQDEITVTNYTLTVVRDEVKEAGILIESKIASWDFTVWSIETLLKMGEDANWIEGLGDRAVDRYANNVAITSSELLYSDNTSIIETRGLIFLGTYRASSDSSDGDFRIDYGVNPASIALNGSNKSIEIPSLLKGDKVIVSASPNTSTETDKRGITASSNTKKISGPEEYIPVGETGEYIFEVTADGDVILTQNGGLKWYTIQVIGKTSVALDAEILEGKSDIELVGDITAEYIPILKVANLTSINLESASSFAEGFEPANPNCLVFSVADTFISESNPAYNLIIDGEAALITLSDNNSFNNPKAFTAETISYTRTYSTAGWASMCLPFSINVSELEGVEVVQEFTRAEGETVFFTNVEEAIEANTPYIANITEAIERTFTSSGVVPATQMNNVEHGGYIFKGNYDNDMRGSGHFLLNGSGTGFGTGSANSVIPAFRAYIEAPEGTAQLVIGKEGDGGATGIDYSSINGLVVNSIEGGLEINSAASQEIRIYSLDGRLVNRTIISEGQTTIGGLQKGIYLLNNQKVVVR